jgi:hypothetical protein
MRKSNIANCLDALNIAGVPFTEKRNGREIVFGQKNIKITHNGQRHWTIRVPGTYAKDGIRMQFGAKIEVANGLFIVDDTVAIKYD